MTTKRMRTVRAAASIPPVRARQPSETIGCARHRDGGLVPSRGAAGDKKPKLLEWLPRVCRPHSQANAKATARHRTCDPAASRSQCRRRMNKLVVLAAFLLGGCLGTAPVEEHAPTNQAPGPTMADPPLPVTTNDGGTDDA